MAKRIYDEDDDTHHGQLRDGERLRVPLMMLDSGRYVVDRPVNDAKNYGLYPLGGTSKEGDACTIDGRPGTLRKVEGGLLCVPDDATDAMLDDSSPQRVCDAFGDSGAGLHRPGSRHLIAGRKSPDHPKLAAMSYNRAQAYRDSVTEACDAWKTNGNTNDRECARVHNTGDARRDAYLDSVADLTSAWSRGR